MCVYTIEWKFYNDKTPSLKGITSDNSINNISILDNISKLITRLTTNTYFTHLGIRSPQDGYQSNNFVYRYRYKRRSKNCIRKK